MSQSPLRTSCLAALLAVFGAWAQAGEPAVPLAQARRANLPPPDTDPFLGVVLADAADKALVASVVAGSAAESAGVRPGDVIERVDRQVVRGVADLEPILAARGIGATLRLEMMRGRNSVLANATLGSRRRADECFRGSKFVLAVVPLRFADDDSPGADSARLGELLFADSGRAGDGASLAEYFRDQSLGRLRVAGRVFAPVELASRRATYATQPMGGSPDSAFAAAAAILEKREGAALGDFDGVAFLYTGPVETRPSFALWPHRSSVGVAGRRIPYYVHGLGDADAASIGVHCHEFGHLLGLPDAYGTGHVTGSGDFCLMAIGHRGGGATGARSPFSLCAWCRVRLGWTDPVLLDPRVPQRVRIRPSAGEVALLPLSPRTDEYVLLEVRRRAGFDAALPSAGLLVWHVGGRASPGQGVYGNYVELVEAHGIDSADASLVRTGEIAFPTARARDLTPDTTPALRSSPGGFPSYLTDIESSADGAVELTVGVARRVVQARPSDEPAPVEEAYLVRTDPVTGREVKLYLGGTPEGPVPPAPTSEGEERR